MKASLIIPTYNRGDVLIETLRMALAQDSHDYEVIVVDQTATVSESLRAFLDSAGRCIRYIRLPFPNLPAARNAAVLAATGEIVIFVDDDVVFDSDYVGSHMCRYTDPSVGAVMGLTFPPGGASDEEALAAARALFGGREVLADGLFTVSWVVGCNSSYRRSAILGAGFSDERFGGSGWCEDADLATRVGHLGYKLLLDRRIKLVHLALPSGGCANRDLDGQKQKELEHVQLFAFHFVKNRRIIGPRNFAHSLWRGYRVFAMNRKVLRAGYWSLLERHVSYLKVLARVRSWSAEPVPRPFAASHPTFLSGTSGLPGEERSPAADSERATRI